MSKEDDLLRTAIDLTWGYALENESVPSHAIATKIIERAREKASVTADCCHDMVPSWSHSKCSRCGVVRTDGDWGIASRRWFQNLAQAEFYQTHGRLPDPIGDTLALPIRDTAGNGDD